MDLGLSGRICIITGASSGFGLATAKVLAQEGARLVVCARREERLQRAADAIRVDGAEVFAQACDVFDAAQAEAFVDAVVEALGGIDILINNVGGLHEPERAMFADTTDDVWMKTLEMNVVQSVRMTRLCRPHMIARGGGAVLNIGSISGVRPSGFDAHYCTAKAAMIMQSRALAQELGRDGIRINTLSPGSARWEGNVWDVIRDAHPDTYADMVGKTPFGRFGRAEDVADVAAFLVSDRARWIHGANIQVDGGQEAVGIDPVMLAALRRQRGGKHKEG